MTTRRLPVSAKAYRNFTERINATVTDPLDRELMTGALTRYLDGDGDTFNARLDDRLRMAFEFLRFDIDQAIARSTRARNRRRNPRPDITSSTEPSTGHIAVQAPTNGLDAANNSNAPESPVTTNRFNSPESPDTTNRFCSPESPDTTNRFNSPESLDTTNRFSSPVSLVKARQGRVVYPIHIQP